MRLPVILVLAAAACAASRSDGDVRADIESVDERSADATLDRLERLRHRRTWPSETDRLRWERALDSADRARAGLAYEPPVRSPDLVPAVEALEQMDALFRVGETARIRPAQRP